MKNPLLDAEVRTESLKKQLGEEGTSAAALAPDGTSERLSVRIATAAAEAAPPASESEEERGSGWSFPWSSRSSAKS